MISGETTRISTWTSSPWSLQPRGLTHSILIENTTLSYFRCAIHPAVKMSKSSTVVSLEPRHNHNSDDYALTRVGKKPVLKVCLLTVIDGTAF